MQNGRPKFTHGRKVMCLGHQDAEPHGGKLDAQGRQRRSRAVAGRDADVDAPGGDLARYLEVGYAAEFDADVRLLRKKRRQRRQQNVSAMLVAADPEHCPLALGVSPHRRGCLLRQLQHSYCFRQERVAGSRQRRMLGAAVDQPFAQVVFETPKRLADRGLRTTQLDGRTREAMFGGHCDEDPEFSQLHKPSQSKRAITLSDDGPLCG
jgi:hypothetical protein